MEQERRLGNIEYYVAQNTKSIENIAYLLKSLNYTFENSGLNTDDPELLRRIEARVERLSKTDSATLGDLFLSEMKKNLDERQKFLNSKILSIEELIIQIGEFANKKALEFQNDTGEKEKLEDIKIALSRFNSDFSEIRNSIYTVEDKMTAFLKQENRIEKLGIFIGELQPFLEKFHLNFESGMNGVEDKFVKLTHLVEDIDKSGELDAVRRDLDNLNISVNAVMSAIQLVEFKYKDIKDSFDKLAKNKDIQSVQANVACVVDKINVLNEIMHLVSTSKDIEGLKGELAVVTAVIEELKGEINNSNSVNDQLFQQTLATLNNKFDSVFTVLSENKAGSNNLNQQVGDLDAKLDNFQEILLKLLALDNVDLVKKDIQDISIRINKLNELIKTVAAAKTVDDIKTELIKTIDIVGELKQSFDGPVLENITNLKGASDIFNEKIDQIIMITSNDSKVIELKGVVDSISEVVRNSHDSINSLREQTILEDIKQKVDTFPDVQDLYNFKDDLHFLLGKISSENDAVRGDLYSLSITLNELMQASQNIALKSDIQEEVSALLSVVENSHNDLKNEVTSLRESLVVKSDLNFNELKKSIEETRHGVTSNLMNYKQDILVKIVDLSAKEEVEKLLDKLREEDEKLGDLKEAVLKKLDQLTFAEDASDILNKIAQNEFVIREEVDSLLTKLETHQDGGIEQLKQDLAAISEEFSEQSDRRYQSIIDGFNEKVFEISNFLKLNESSINEKVSTVIEKLEQKPADQVAIRVELDTLKETILDDNLTVKESILSRIDQISVYDEVRSIIDSINNQEEGLRQVLSDVAHNIEVTLENNSYDALEQNMVERVSDKISEIKSNILADNQKLLNLVAETSRSNKDELINQIHIAKDEVLKQASQNRDVIGSDVEQKLQNVIDNILNQASNNKNELSDSIENNIKEAKNDIIGEVNRQNIDNVIGSIEHNVHQAKDEIIGEINRQNIDNVIGSIEHNVHQAKDEIIEQVNKQNIDNIVNEAKNEVLSASYNNKVSLSEEIQQASVSIKDDISSLDNKLSEFDIDDGHFDSIKELLDEYKNVLDNLSTTEDANNIQKAINELSENFTLQVIQLFENISFIEEVEELREIIENSQVNLISEIQTLKQTIDAGSSFQNNLTDNNDNKNLMYEITALRDFIESLKLEETSSLKSAFVEVLDNFVDLNEKAEESIKEDIKIVNHNISEVLDEIKLLSGKSSEGDLYLYTLDDVQSDFAKMRLVLNDITNAIGLGPINTDIIDRLKENIGSMSDMLSSPREDFSDAQVDDLKDQFSDVLGLFNEMNKEVYDISLRTNKLILTSEDNNQELKTNLATFKEVINNINEKANPERVHNDIVALTNSIMDLKQSVNLVSKCSNNNLQSIEFVKEALMHMAEWIDGTGSLLNQMNSDVESVKAAIESLPSVINSEDERISVLTSETANIANIVNGFEDKIDNLGNELSVVKEHVGIEINKVSEKFFSFESRLDSIEKKLEEIKNTKKEEEDIRPILEFIASQASAANENARLNTEMLARIQNMEQKVASFDANINKLVSYVDEE